MNERRYHRDSHVTVTNENRGIRSVTNVTHPFRGVTDVTVPDLPNPVTCLLVLTGRKQENTARFLPVDTGHFLMVENGGQTHG